MCMVKKELLACSSSAIKQVCLPVREAAIFTLVSGVLVGESASFARFVYVSIRNTEVEVDVKTPSLH